MSACLAVADALLVQTTRGLVGHLRAVATDRIAPDDPGTPTSTHRHRGAYRVGASVTVRREHLQGGDQILECADAAVVGQRVPVERDRAMAGEVGLGLHGGHRRERLHAAVEDEQQVLFPRSGDGVVPVQQPDTAVVADEDVAQVRVGVAGNVR
jgi:hypothetical protein